jgi:carbon storage regulator
MLVLTRKKDESIVIGGDVTIQVISIQGDKVRLGITAPPDVGVWRSEVAREIEQQGGDVRISHARKAG